MHDEMKLPKIIHLGLFLGLFLIGPQRIQPAETFPVPEAAPETVASASQLEAPRSGATSQPPVAREFTSVASGPAGLMDDGVAIFYPEGLEPKSAPDSPALVRRPSIVGKLPENWPLRPKFSQSGEYFRATLEIDKAVDLYGGGEVTGPLRRNGTSIKLWNTDNFGYRKDGSVRLYQSHPWIMGVRPDGKAFGVIFDSTWKAELSCKEGVSFEVHGTGFPVIVIERNSPEEVLKALGKLTGLMDLPPRWALGYQQCRWSYNPDSKVKSIADEFRARRLPCDVIWMDIDYMDGFRVFTFNKSQFPDPKGLNEYLHQKGFKSIWMIDPGIKVDPSYSVYKSGLARDVFVKSKDGTDFHGNVWPGPCAFPDFTRPETRSWWAGLFADFMGTGIDGVWNDMNEPSVFKGPDGTMPEDNVHRGGGGLLPGTHRQYHNTYGMLMARATRDGILAANPAQRPFVLTRANFLGGQRYAATWTGDNASTQQHMELSIPMTLTLGLSGQPFNGPDLGGFGENATPELWSKWVGFGTLLPFARGHACKGTNNKEPWAFGPAVEKTARIALERRYRLLPYIYTLFRQASVSGVPVVRPMFMADVKDPALRKEQEAFLLGGDLIVVPSWSKTPALPSGTFPVISLIEGDLADPDQATLRIRPGAIVPLGRVVQNTTEESLDPLTLLVCLDDKGEAEGVLYEDDGDGFGYRTGDYRLTTFKARQNGDKVVLSVAASEGKRPQIKRTVQVQVVRHDGMQAPFAQVL